MAAALWIRKEAMETLYLNPSTWDLELTADGDIAYAKAPYSTAQCVANAIRLFEGELYYDTEQGVPYFDEVLGRPHSFALFKHRMEEAAMRVAGVKDVIVSVNDITNRGLSGSVRFKDENNQVHTVAL